MLFTIKSSELQQLIVSKIGDLQETLKHLTNTIEIGIVAAEISTLQRKLKCCYHTKDVLLTEQEMNEFVL